VYYAKEFLTLGFLLIGFIVSAMFGNLVTRNITEKEETDFP
jgi:hypothetical protein